MRIKKRLIEKDDYYEYSASYIKKYILIVSIILLIATSIFLFIYINYKVIPNKSYSRNDLPTLDSTITSITNAKGIYYTGNFSEVPKSIQINDNMIENLYLYLFHDNHIIFWKLYKKGR